MAEEVSGQRNLLLDSLSDADRSYIFRNSELISLSVKQELYLPNKTIEYAYFPCNGVMSLLAPLEEGQLIEVATVGNEGMVGIPLFLGADSTPGAAFAQVPGSAYRLPARDLRQLIVASRGFSNALQRYTQALMIQISQGNACNRLHSDLQRCARWLLLTHDRAGKDEFELPLEFLGQMLGTPPSRTGEIMSRLQNQGILAYNGMLLRIQDRARLQKVSCQCYAIIRKEYDRMYEEAPLEN
jgi:CRP-like cAMP-binding protein